MQKQFRKVIGWLGRALAAEITQPITELSNTVKAQSAAIIALQDRVSKLHEQDEAALECDLSIMDDRICHLIGICRQRGYTTSEERRRITRMHEAYRARGGNHGEENEYAVFCRLPTEEDYMRKKGA